MAEKYSSDMTAEDKAARRTQRMAELKQQREAAALQRALARAQSNPKFNFTQRPEGKIDEQKGVIKFYGWNGSKDKGQWVLREAELNPENLEKYQTRVPANQYVVKDYRSVPTPLKGISGQEQQADGFMVDATGKLVTQGKVDSNLLTIKSEYEQKGVQQKAATREEAALQRAMQRAQQNPVNNFLSRPAGKIMDDKIMFYSWIGGKDSGQWVLYEAFNTPTNLNKYKTRVPAVEYFPPTSIRDVLIPKTNIFGEYQGTPIVTK